MHTKTVLLIGRPGSGKGTQAKLLADEFGWSRLSSGDTFKALRDGEGTLSDRVRASYDAGKLLPDWFAAYILEDTMLKLSNEASIVVEGFGRTRAQAQHLLDVVSWLGRDLTVVHLAVTEDEALRRQVERSKIEHRPDSDAEDKVRARFAEFTANTQPALDFFQEQNMLIEIDGEQTPEVVATSIRQALGLSA